MMGEEKAVSAAGQLGQTALDLFLRGGIFMWPLLALSVIALTLILYKLFDVMIFSVSIKGLQKFLLTGGKGGSSRLLPFIKQIDLTRETHRSLFNNTIQLHFDRRTRILAWFNALGTGSSTLGFIGTVAGMISAFDAISKAEQVSVQLTAGGISEALITTGFGLIISVVCLLAESYFRYVQVTLAHQTNTAIDIYMLNSC